MDYFYLWHEFASTKKKSHLALVRLKGIFRMKKKKEVFIKPNKIR